jgi:hypothetical protein
MGRGGPPPLQGKWGGEGPRRHQTPTYLANAAAARDIILHSYYYYYFYNCYYFSYYLNLRRLLSILT